MGICYNKRDKTKYILSQKFKIQEAYIHSLENFNEKNRLKFKLTKDIEARRNCLTDRREHVKKNSKINIGNNNLIPKNISKLCGQYEINEQIGEGGYGVVYKVKHIKTHLVRAMKRIYRNKNRKDDSANNGSSISVKKNTSPMQNINEELSILREIELLISLDHPNIVKIFEYFITEDSYYLITEYCKGGNLLTLKNKFRIFTEQSAAYIMYQVFRGVTYCHENKVIHRDLKPENIVIVDENNLDENLYNIKIIDFGTAKIYDKNVHESTITGSPNYIAPEVLSKNYNEKCDLWSCGVILYVLVVGILPFKGKNRQETLEKINAGNYIFPEEFKTNSSPEVKSLIDNCLMKDPNKRISAKEALNHPWFDLYDTKSYFIHVTEAFLAKTIMNIKKYNPKNKLQEIAFAYIVHNLPMLEERSKIDRVFNLFNVSKSGKLSKEETIVGLRKYLFGNQKGLADKEAEEIFEKLDNNKNGFIECEEFARGALDKKIFKNENILKFTFDFLDINKDGEISVEELIAIFGIQNTDDEEELKNLLISIDTDCNGQISYDEYKSMMLEIIS